MMCRRTFVAALATIAAPRAAVATARQLGMPPTIGFLGSTDPAAYERALNAFRAGLRERGYVEGHNIVVEYRWAEGRTDRYASLVAELLRAKPVLIVSECGVALDAIRQVSRSVPVVVGACADSTHFQGEIATLARPGGRTTGFTFLAPEAAGKRLEFLKLMSPGLARLAVLTNAVETYSEYWGQMVAAAPKLNVTLHKYTAARPADLDAIFASIARDRMQAVMILSDALTMSQRARIADLAIKHRVATAFDIRLFVFAGGLLSYGAVPPDLYRRAADYVDRIIKGAHPGDLPVEQPTTFELVINARTARALGLTIPPSLLLRADQVID